MGTFAVATRDSMLNAFARNVSYTNAAVWVKLHTADPGAAGTTAPATNATRQQATFATAAATGTISNTAVVEWLSVSTTEIYSHVSFWTASTAGTFLGSDDLSTAASVTAGDTMRIAIGQLTLSIS